VEKENVAVIRAQEVLMTRVLLLGLTLLLVPFQLSAQTRPGISKEGVAELSRYLTEMVDGTRVPGLVALVVGPDGVLYQEAFGKLNTHFWVDPNRRVGVVLLMQVLPFYDESCIELLRRFEQRMYKNLH
jgi:hypothetical protein